MKDTNKNERHAHQDVNEKKIFLDGKRKQELHKKLDHCTAVVQDKEKNTKKL